MNTHKFLHIHNSTPHNTSTHTHTHTLHDPRTSPKYHYSHTGPSNNSHPFLAPSYTTHHLALATYLPLPLATYLHTHHTPLPFPPTYYITHLSPHLNEHHFSQVYVPSQLYLFCHTCPQPRLSGYLWDDAGTTSKYKRRFTISVAPRG